MKKLVICEGKNDSFLLQNICSILNLSPLKVFDQNTRDNLQDIKNAETRELRRFLEKSNMNRILIKSEVGKRNVIRLSSLILLQCINCKLIDRIVIMIDLDEVNINESIIEINNRITENKTGSGISIQSSIVKNTNSIYLVKNVIILNKNQEIGSYYYIFFKSSLETEINRYVVDEIELNEKIIKFASNNEVKEMFSAALQI